MKITYIASSITLLSGTHALLTIDSASTPHRPTTTTSLNVAEPIETIPSQSVPFAECPAVLDGSLAGDVGFDPLCLAKDKETLWRYREAEIKHARLAMLAAAGWPLSELLDKRLAHGLNLLPLVDDHNRVPSLFNGGLDKVPTLYWVMVLALGAAADIYGMKRMKDDDYRPGDLGLDLTGHYRNKGIFRRKVLETVEIKNGRLAMLAVTGYALQEYFTADATIQAL